MGWINRLVNVFRKERLDRQIDEELEFHLAERARDNIASGMNPEEARRDARRRFGNTGLALENAREANIFAPLEALGQDLRFAIRMMRRRPGFAAMAVLLAGLGIGASTAMFSLLMGAVFPKSAFENSDRLVFLWRHDKTQGLLLPRASFPDLRDIRGESHSLERVSIYRRTEFAVNTSGEPQQVQGFAIDSDWLHALGVSPSSGRNILPGDQDVALVTNELGQRLFDGANALGRRIRIDNRPFTIVGVLPAGFTFDNVEIFVPLTPDADAQQRDRFVYYGLANLRAGVSLSQARAETAALVPGRENWAMRVATSRDRLSFACGPTCDQQHKGIWLLFGAASVVMLMASANVANLLLARSIGRRCEFVIRTAIGCSRGRLIRQVFTESLVLFLCGGTLGILLGRWFSVALARFAPSYASSAGLDTRALAFSALVTLVTAVLFGLVPAVRAAAPSAPRVRKTAPGLLVASEFTLALVLLVGFGLLLRSFLRVEAIPAGFRTERLLTIGTSLSGVKYRDMAQRVAFAHRLLERVRLLPAVTSAAMTSNLPLTGAGDTRIRVEGLPLAPLEVRYVSVSPNFFQALEVPILAGRALTEHDGTSAGPVVVINETMARALFPWGDAVGRRIQMEEQPAVWREIVGIAANVRQRNLEEDSRPVFYRPYEQGLDLGVSLAVRVRSSAEMPQVAEAMRKSVRNADPQQPWDAVETMRQIIYDSESLSLRRPIVRLLGAFALIALTLAGAGLFAVLSHSVAERRREIGIRMAVGARQTQVLWQIAGDTFRFTLPGALIGAGSAYALSALLPSGQIGWSGSGVFLYGVSRSDAVTYLGVFLGLCCICIAATFIPARRAMRVDPAVALREE
jgi:putative ABC transport system permease protein